MPPSRLIGPQSRVAFFCCDLQEKFAPRIPNFAQCVFVANRFAQAHQHLKDSSVFIATEQYPQGLGATVPQVILPASCKPIAKKKFSMVVDDVVNYPGFAACDTVVLFGIEAHVCVLQTANDLVERGLTVVLAKDGLGSQDPHDAQTALDLMRTWSPQLYISTSESILFQLLRGADHPQFKEVSKIVRDRFSGHQS